jgi:hypothetical protein
MVLVENTPASGATDGFTSSPIAEAGRFSASLRNVNRFAAICRVGETDSDQVSAAQLVRCDQIGERVHHVSLCPKYPGGDPINLAIS